MEDRVAKDVEGVTITLVGYMQPNKEGKSSFIR
jgi:hypothetical protein